MRLNRFLTSGTISLKHYLRAFYTLLPLSCFFKDNPQWIGYLSCHIRTLFLPGFGNDFLKR